MYRQVQLFLSLPCVTEVTISDHWLHYSVDIQSGLLLLYQLLLPHLSALTLPDCCCVFSSVASPHSLASGLGAWQW